MLKRCSRVLAVVLFFCALASTAARAQTPTGQISGRVTDASGAVLPGVDVTVTQTDTGLVRSAITNETGQYVVPSLPIGPYRLEAALQGFRTFVQADIVAAGQREPGGRSRALARRAERDDHRDGAPLRHRGRDAQHGRRRR